MSMDAVRKAFMVAAEGLARLTDASLAYKDNGQVLTLAGFHADGLPFAVTTQPFVGSPQIRAMDAARDIVRTHVGRSSPHPPATPLVQAITPAQVDAQMRAAVQPPFAPQEPAPIQAFRERRAMAKPGFVAERLKALKANIEAESDKLLSEIDGIEKTAVPSAFAKGRKFLDMQHADVKALEAELAQLTNLPLDDGPLDPSKSS